MATVEENMKRPNFRVKVNLSSFFHDARRFCWIFIDGMNIQRISDVQRHLSKVFSISEPFHLLLNNTEYLSPVEDVRVLREDETILVIPGSVMNNTVSDVGEISNISSYHGQEAASNPKTQIITQKAFESISKDKFKNTLDITRPSSMNTTRDMTFYSIINDTINTEVTSEDDTESKTTDNNLNEDCDVTEDSNASIVKRKRVRKRKPKNKSQPTMLHNETGEKEEIITKEPCMKKPKIINSFTIPSGKHIRFNNTENDENNLAKEIVQEISRDESYLNKMSSKDLSTLLALRQSSTPKTFVRRYRNGIETENKSDISTEDLESTIEKVFNNVHREIPPKKHNPLETELEKLPVMTRKPEINDVIAFRVLKLGQDYTPQISEYIITKVTKVDISVNPIMYTFQILRGKEEVNLPSGKFSISDDSECRPDVDTLKLNYSEMRDLRLIS